MALAETALELLYVMSVLRTLGHVFESDEPKLDCADHEACKYVGRANEIVHGPIDTATDSQSAHDLCHRKTVGQNSRHVERKVFKMRELQHNNQVRVRLIPTAENAADLLTKVLGNKTFQRHRATLMNLAAVS